MKNRNIILTTILLTLGSFALPQRTQAVVPAPDGGYPGFNTAEGQNALFSISTDWRRYNTAVGWCFTLVATLPATSTRPSGAATAPYSTTVGRTIRRLGAGALFKQHHRQRQHGHWSDAPFPIQSARKHGQRCSALLNNTIGIDNTATGDNALYNNTTGNSNTAIGPVRLRPTPEASTTPLVRLRCSRTPPATATRPVVLNALLGNATGGHNTAIGASALGSNIAAATRPSVIDAF